MSNQFTNGGYATGNPYMSAMQYGPVQQKNRPQMTNPLTQEERKCLLTAEDCFNLKVTKEELAKAICTHKDQEKGTFATVPGTNPMGDVTCTICHETFFPDLLNEKYVQDTTNNMLNILQSLKWLGVDLNVDVIRQYFAMIPYIARVPKLYKAVDAAFKKYNMSGQASATQQTNPNVINFYNMLANPSVPVGAPNYMNGFGQQAQQMTGANPFYNNVAPQQQAPMPGAAPAGFTEEQMREFNEFLQFKQAQQQGMAPTAPVVPMPQDTVAPMANPQDAASSDVKVTQQLQL